MSVQKVKFGWEGKLLSANLESGRNQCLLEIVLDSDSTTTCFTSKNTEDGILSLVAQIVLESNVNYVRQITKGEVARVLVNEPSTRPISRIRNLGQAMALRPTIEELIAPLIFERNSRPVLRPFQDIGVKWLVSRPVGILADDMGLGKTVQALIAVKELLVNGLIRYAVIICPKSLLANWESECSRWVPSLTVLRVEPPRNQSSEVWKAILRRSHLILTSYEQVRVLPDHLASSRFELIVADEAHRLRRSQAKLVKSFRRLTSDRFWALTGTPIERHESDFATLLSLLAPTRFSVRSAATGFSDFKAQARPYVLRRLKEDVLNELPEVIDTTETIELTTQQRRSYSAIRSKPLAKDDGDVLKRFTLLRSVCDVEPISGSSAKIDRIAEILLAVRDSGEKAIVFSYLLKPLNLLEKRLARGDSKVSSLLLTGKLSASDRDRVLRKYRSDDSIVALLCSSRVGGEGLTLTEANHVVFLNEWWNPSANSQARDRVVRLGQKRIVHIHRFRCRGTIEELLEQILSRKKEAFTKIVDALVVGEDLSDYRVNELLDRDIRDELVKHVST